MLKLEEGECLDYTVTEVKENEYLCVMLGPEWTPYEGGIFLVLFVYPSDYPFKPPKVRILTKIFHVGVNEHGCIDLDILHDNWSPALTIRHLITSIKNLLGDPNYDCPLNMQYYDMHKTDPEQAREKARSWTQQYAI